MPASALAEGLPLVANEAKAELFNNTTGRRIVGGVIDSEFVQAYWAERETHYCLCSLSGKSTALGDGRDPIRQLSTVPSPGSMGATHVDERNESDDVPVMADNPMKAFAGALRLNEGLDHRSGFFAALVRFPGQEFGDAEVGDMRPQCLDIIGLRRLQREPRSGKRIAAWKIGQGEIHRSENRDMRRNWRLLRRKGLVLSTMKTCSDSVHWVTRALAPMKQRSATRTPWPTVLFTAKKQP